MTSQAGLNASPVLPQLFFHILPRTLSSGLEIPGCWFISPAFGFPKGWDGVLFCVLLPHAHAHTGTQETSSKYLLTEDE